MDEYEYVDYIFMDEYETSRYIFMDESEELFAAYTTSV